MGVFAFGAWCIKWSFASLFFIAIMAASGYYVFTQAVAGGEHVTVPNIIGLPITRASYLLAEKGLEIGKQTQIFSENFPEYHVVAQRPAAGKVVRAGRKIFPTVSAGHQFEKTPSLVGKTLASAREEIIQRRFQPGSVARMPSNAAKDLVVSQDPASQTEIVSGSEIHLLVSDGPSWKRTAMPTLVGKPITEVMGILSSMKLTSIPAAVDKPGDPYDVVLTQEPSPNSPMRENDVVRYTVRLSGTISLPNVRRRIELKFRVPEAFHEKELRIDIVDREGRKTVLPSQEEYDTGVRKKFAGGTLLRYKRTFIGELTIEIYVEEELTRSYFYRQSGAPIIQDYTAGVRGRPNGRN